MKQLKLMLMVLTALCLIGVASAAVVPVTIDKVEVEGTELVPDAANRLDLERGQDIEVRITLVAEGDAENVQIEAFISGYEYSDFESISDVTHVFDVEDGEIHVKKLKLRLPEKADEDNYKLRIIVSDRYSHEIFQNYNLKVDSPRHYVKVMDAWFTPENTVYAGEYLIASVRLKNYGDKDEEGIRVKVSIPELGVSASDYIDELEKGDSISSEELYLKIPRCNVEEGLYEVFVDVNYDEGYEGSPEFDTMINVASAGPCEAEQAEEQQVVVSLETLNKKLVAGGDGVSFPITMTNTGDSTRTIVLALPEVAWGSLRVSPSNAVVLKGGETKTAYVFATADKGTEEGDYQFSVGLNSVTGTELESLTFTAEVGGKTNDGAGVTQGLEIALVVLIVILIIIGLILGLRRLRGGSVEAEEEVSGETYY